MYKIEHFLLIKANHSNTISVVKQFLKESSFLINNLYSTYIIDKHLNHSFPAVDDEYDTAWYKNILIASAIIKDRLNGKIEENKPYIEMLKHIEYVNFKAFAKQWNEINLLVSFNLSVNEWMTICSNLNLKECAIKLQVLVAAQIEFNMVAFQNVALDVGQYKRIATASDNLVSDDTYEDKVSFDNLDIHIANSSADTNIKELDLVLNWLKENQLQIKKYKSIARINARPHELKHIEELIATLDAEIKSNNDLLNAIIVKLPENPYLKSYAEFAKWIDSYSENIVNDEVTLSEIEVPAQITSIEKEIKNTEHEIFLIDSTLQLIRDNTPNHELLQQFEEILAWIDLKEQKINASIASSVE